MARILAYTSPAAGHLFPITPILDELSRRGHQIALRTLASQVPLMKTRGFDTAPVSEQVEAIRHDDWRASNARAGLVRAVRTFSERAAFDAPDLRNAIAQERPDALLVDINGWGGLAVAEAWGGPWASFCPYPLALRSRDVPPFGLAWKPMSGPLGHLRDGMARPIVTASYNKAMLPSLNAVRADLGLSRLQAADDIYLRPPLVLYLTAEPFEYPRSDWPPSVVMVGPCDWDPPLDPPPWLEQVTEPIVLVTTSTEFQDDGRLVRAALEGLAGEPVTVVATLPAGNAADFAIPGHARLERFIPHSLLLDRSVVAVTHGGMGATQKALVRGVPVCAVPFGRDQFEVARRVEVSGAGTSLPAKRLSPERLRAKVHEAMNRTKDATRLAAALAAPGGPTAAADAFEHRLLTTSADA
jgi:MGT family glycosyltransferase